VIHAALIAQLAIVALFVACGPTPENQVDTGHPPAGASDPAAATATDTATGFRFTDVGVRAGLDFINVSGSVTQDFVLESMSAGAAFIDYDGDGFQDLFVVNGTRLTETPPEGARNRLFHNEAASPSDSIGTRKFREVDRDFGVAGWGMGCAAGDYDNDGDVDLYVTYWGPNRLYRNDGGGFVEVADSAGVADRGWGSSAAFGDLDADGLLDLYVTNYLEFDPQRPPGGGGKCLYKGMEVFCGPAYAPRQADRLYRNEGDGTFADVSAATGVGGYGLPALGVIFGDFDADSDLDIYVANDGEPNSLFRNDGGWQLTEIGRAAGVAFNRDGKAQASMGVHAGDFDRDGDLDLFATNFSDDYNTLYRNDGSGHFSDATSDVGLGESSLSYLGWGTGFVDFDNDGWLDLFVANGHLHPQLDQSFHGLFYAQRNLLYRNRQGRYVEAGQASGRDWSVEKVSRAAAVGDYDNDGDSDLFIMNLNDRPTLLRNDSGGNDWLGLLLIGTQSNRDAIGARVWVRGEGFELVREVHRGWGFQAQQDPRLLFGLGQGRRVEEIEIRWPSGRRQVITDAPSGRYLTIRESWFATDQSR
jgi:hypothetical protein